jgi:predicted nucleic acid-binding protein
LGLIGEVELLPKLFRKVLVPRAVRDELLAKGAPIAREISHALYGRVLTRE